jgi:hypothetical protein
MARGPDGCPLAHVRLHGRCGIASHGPRSRIIRSSPPVQGPAPRRARGDLAARAPPRRWDARPEAAPALSLRAHSGPAPIGIPDCMRTAKPPRLPRSPRRGAATQPLRAAGCVHPRTLPADGRTPRAGQRRAPPVAERLWCRATGEHIRPRRPRSRTMERRAHGAGCSVSGQAHGPPKPVLWPNTAGNRWNPRRESW